MGIRPITQLGIAGIAFGGLLVIGGAIGGDGLGPLAQGYGVLIVLSGIFMLGGLGLRHLLGSAHHSPAQPARATQASAESTR